MIDIRDFVNNVVSVFSYPVPDSVWRINTDVPEEGKNVSLDTSNDDRWWDQVDLSKLILASNTLTAISPQITQLPALSVLDVSMMSTSAKNWALFSHCKLLAYKESM